MAHWTEEYELTTRTRNILEFYVASLDALKAMSDNDILSLPNAGWKTWTEIKYVFFGCEPKGLNKLPKGTTPRLQTPRPLKPAGRSVYLVVDEMDEILGCLQSGPLKDKILQAVIDAGEDYEARIRLRSTP